ncbi:MAG: F0F1 ATP synthase subunit B [Ruminococcus sp.]|nr:F0F1 ATP synthase subunit B [Oscillospiraceae bacterium]MDY4413436.1 F0F1 ATP synthase subunit B [Ruminococcus sp.]
MNLDFLTIDIGSIIFNLANTLILFLVIKHFLFKPVNDIIEQRKHDVEETYSLADEALENARQSEKKYNDLIGNAREESAKIIKNASETANRRSEEIISEAKSNADMIIKKANSEIEREKANARSAVRDEVSDLAVMVAEKVIDKEINSDDHRRFIDEFIENVGENND